MEAGSTMGAAMAITIGEDGETKAVGEKYMSFMRAVFRSVAEKRVERGASGEEEAFVAFAEAMTDPDVEVVRIDVEGVEKFVRRSILNEYARKLEKDGKKVEVLEPVVEKGKLLTVTAKEAFERYRFIDGVVKDRDDLLATLGVVKPPVKAPEPSWPENLGRFLGGQFISGLLMSIAMLGLLMEVFAPGKGVGAFVFLFGIGAFFWAQYLAGQAGPFEVVFFVVGVILLAVEVFALPGFGVFGISGVGLILVGLVLAFIPAGSVSAPGLPEMPFPYDRLRVAIFTVLVALTGAAIGIALFARFLPHVPLFKHLALQPDAATVGGDIPVAGSAAPADDIARYVGSRAVAHTPLRPAGKIEIAGTYVDAVTDAEFVDAGTAVEVVEVSGNRVVVKRAGAGGAV
jgi:membrane-bound serine protease (ClpP class)